MARTGSPRLAVGKALGARVVRLLAVEGAHLQAQERRTMYKIERLR